MRCCTRSATTRLKPAYACRSRQAGRQAAHGGSNSIGGGCNRRPCLSRLRLAHLPAVQAMQVALRLRPAPHKPHRQLAAAGGAQAEAVHGAEGVVGLPLARRACASCAGRVSQLHDIPRSKVGRGRQRMLAGGGSRQDTPCKRTATLLSLRTSRKLVRNAARPDCVPTHIHVPPATRSRPPRMRWSFSQKWLGAVGLQRGAAGLAGAASRHPPPAASKPAPARVRHATRMLCLASRTCPAARHG